MVQKQDMRHWKTKLLVSLDHVIFKKILYIENGPGYPKIQFSYGPDQGPGPDHWKTLFE